MMAGSRCDPGVALPVMGSQARRITRGPCAFSAAPGLSAADVIGASIRCTAVSRGQPLCETAGCQPLGAWHCAQGFANCLPVLLDGAACQAHFNRFLERQGYLVESDPLDRDAAIAPSTVSAPFSTPAPLEAVFSTCLARTPAGHTSAAGVRHRARAQTPSFVGSHGHGWDAMFEAMIKALRPADLPLASRLASRDSINLVLGFELLPRNYAVMEQLFEAVGLHVRLLSDARFTLASPEAPPINPRGTPLSALRAAPGASHTLIARPWQLPRTQALVSERWGHACAGLPIPMGLSATDTWLQLLGEQAGAAAPPPVLAEARRALVEQMADARERVAKRRIALYGEPDFVLGAARLLRDLATAPALLICPHGDRHWQRAMRALLDSDAVPIVTGQDRTALTEGLEHANADLLIAPPGYAALRDPDSDDRLARLPLVDLDHRQSGPPPATLGYAGAMFMVQRLLEAIGGDQ